jgi:opacity protein-like surface antigen
MKKLLLILICVLFEISPAVSRSSENSLKDQFYSNSAGTLIYTGVNSSSPDEESPAAKIGIGILAGELILLSNDFYIYPSYSFVKGYYKDEDYIKGTGVIFGFRKTFNYSALEYGISITTFSDRYYMSDGTTIYSKIYLNRKPGIHLNYVHQFLYGKTPSWLKLYAGPTLNLVNEFGFGGILGTEFRLIKRFTFDLRYEYSTQTNQIQAGIIFKFQKEYFWRKD